VIAAFAVPPSLQPPDDEALLRLLSGGGGYAPPSHDAFTRDLANITNNSCAVQFAVT
jgi:hypothetical protein